MVAGTIPINKVYGDSTFKTQDSKSNSDFKYDLLESVQLPDKCVCFIDDIIIPVRWYNTDENDKYIYVRRFQDFKDNKTKPDTLTDAVQEPLNTAFGAGFLVYHMMKET